jgi:hypothetical protein
MHVEICPSVGSIGETITALPVGTDAHSLRVLLWWAESEVLPRQVHVPQLVDTWDTRLSLLLLMAGVAAVDVVPWVGAGRWASARVQWRDRHLDGDVEVYVESGEWLGRVQKAGQQINQGSVPYHYRASPAGVVLAEMTSQLLLGRSDFIGRLVDSYP